MRFLLGIAVGVVVCSIWPDAPQIVAHGIHEASKSLVELTEQGMVPEIVGRTVEELK